MLKAILIAYGKSSRLEKSGRQSLNNSPRDMIVASHDAEANDFSQERISLELASQPPQDSMTALPVASAPRNDGAESL
ncbi:hypothetical protein [Bradyrhizobium sp. BR 10289]|uniref:hypothetical protein n=1 Tax=Bradyrhizobium sp. BR 10289 TaxID=2749993 RepID=UPI001C64625F|nr:hypothetical protein [Bradyrhizobium sp. BR 10289]MBW7973465.1 hypothetical protein [Bradyrhizobium sp. BR 10289]